MPIVIESLPQGPKPGCSRSDAIAVLHRLRTAGHEAYFAGGCVRDELMGLVPKDFDVATSAPPKVVRALFASTRAVGQAFGVVLVKHRRSTVEVATFRTEFDYQDGRRPTRVKFATAQEDAQRRDFTINGLFLDPDTGRVIDFVGGQEDIKARRLRAIGKPEDRFAEDHLRLLRAVRFAAQFGLDIDPATAQAIRAHAPLLKRISPERIAEELRLMLTGPRRIDAWRLLWDFALIDTICRFLSPSGAAAYDRQRCPFAQLPGDDQISFGLALAAGTLSYRMHTEPAAADVEQLLGHSEMTRITRAMRQALKISNDELDAMQGTLAGAAMMLHEELRSAEYKRFAARPTAGDSQRLLESIARTGQHQHRIATVLAELRKLQGTVVAPEPLINGDDLRELGLVPGPAFRRILDAVYDAQLEQRVTDRTAALALASQLAAR
jgi:tRNA nucleotidyltransferase/poly(A) polymerase